MLAATAMLLFPGYHLATQLCDEGGEKKEQHAKTFYAVLASVIQGVPKIQGGSQFLPIKFRVSGFWQIFCGVSAGTYCTFSPYPL